MWPGWTGLGGAVRLSEREERGEWRRMDGWAGEGVGHHVFGRQISVLFARLRACGLLLLLAGHGWKGKDGLK
jgi:hypothetical protein